MDLGRLLGVENPTILVLYALAYHRNRQRDLKLLLRLQTIRQSGANLRGIL